jgi:hypothetical protein
MAGVARRQALPQCCLVPRRGLAAEVAAQQSVLSCLPALSSHRARLAPIERFTGSKSLFSQKRSHDINAPARARQERLLPLLLRPPIPYA